ncbi:MAG TPA: hypothetical protein VHW09_04475 [Bryobacteraceae bacterium]|jgi:uncharacterized protein (TIGR03437 family)|nr:hypothetical protein [Bryobacteraceae bacterium]
MRRFRHLLVSAVSLFGLAGADGPPPAIVPGGIVNAASRLPATLRGGALAPGMRIFIPGVRLGPENPERGSESEPLVRLADVTVRIRQGARAVDAGLLLVSATEIEAWMPDATPSGDVELTVTYRGLASEPYRLTLTRANAGFYSPSTAPDGLPEAKIGSSAVRGGTVTLWGTGLGGLAELFVGGRRADDLHISPAECCKGVDAIAFRVPSDAPYGCFVPVMSRTADDRPGNAVSIAIHPAGEPCHDDLDWFRTGVEQAARAGFVALARVSVDIAPVREVAPNPGQRFQFDYGIASFGRQESGERQFPPLPPLGTCTVFASHVNLRQLLGQSRNPAEWTSMPDRTRGNRRLDAGGAISVNGPRGERRLGLDRHQQEYYDAALGGSRPFSRERATPLYLTPGRYTVSAPGGADVGGFSVKVKVTEPLVWKNRERLAAVDRDAGATIEWKAALNQDAILILAENVDRSSGDSGACLCMAPARAGRFHIPPLALGNLPATIALSGLETSYLLLMELPVDPPAQIEATGLDKAFAGFISISARPVTYK